ncbi:MAG: hypothetical protein Kow0077_14840 [Anaerolineae bacterium]
MVSVEILRRYPFFAGFTHEQLAQIGHIARLETFARGETILHEGEPAQTLYVVHRGQVGLWVMVGPNRDQRVDLVTIVEGEAVGWSALVTERRTATAEALTDVVLIALDADDLHALFEQDRDLAYKMIWRIADVLANRLSRMHYQLASMAPVNQP